MVRKKQHPKDRKPALGEVKKVFVKDCDLKYVWCNEHYAKDLGIRQEDIVGKTDFDFYPKELAEKYRKDDREVLETGETKDLEEEYTINNETYLIHTVKVPFRNKGQDSFCGVVGTFWDTLERHQLEEEVQSGKDLLQQILEGIPDPVFVKDEESHWIYLNEAFCEFIGHTREELIGKSDYDFFPKEEADIFRQKDREVFESMRKNVNEEEFTDNSGNTHHISTKKQAFLSSNGRKILVGVIRDMTERIQVEQELAESNARYKALYNASSEAIMLLTPEGQFLGGNPATITLFGCRDEEEFKACTPYMLSPSMQSDGQPSEAKAKSMINIALQDGSHRFEWVHRRMTGEDFQAVVSLTKMELEGKTVVQAIVRDISEQKHSEELLLEANRKLEEEALQSKKFKQATDASSIATVITDTDSNILYVNEAWSKLTGYSFQEAKGKKPNMLQSGKTPKGMYEKMWNTILQGEDFITDEIVNKRKDGSEFNAELHVYPVMDKEGSALFFVGLQTDITLRIRGDKAKSEFISLASHQLRTPLTGIRWGIGMLRKKGKMTISQEQIANEMQAATARMSETIDTMLQLSRIEARKVELAVQDVKLSVLIDELAKEIEQISHGSTQKHQYECPPDMVLRTDPSLLREILMNLLTNAMKYTPETGSVSLLVKHLGDTVRFTVRDTGMGIPTEQQGKIFSKFFRADNVVDKIPDGTGLGLYLVYSLTKLLGGHIDFVSALDKGTTFTLTLPVTPPSHG